MIGMKRKFWDVMDLLVQDPHHGSLKTHKLSGKLSGLWAFSLDYDYRVVFMFVRNSTDIILIDIGTHDEVY
jgi:addiction module RelE/StbE family toxin